VLGWFVNVALTIPYYVHFYLYYPSKLLSVIALLWLFLDLTIDTGWVLML